GVSGMYDDEPGMEELKRLLRRLDGLGGGPAMAGAAQVVETRRYPWDGDWAGRDCAPSIESSRPRRTAIYAATKTAAVISTVAASMVVLWLGAPGRPVTGPLPPVPELPTALDHVPFETVDRTW